MKIANKSKGLVIAFVVVNTIYFTSEDSRAQSIGVSAADLVSAPENQDQNIEELQKSKLELESDANDIVNIVTELTEKIESLKDETLRLEAQLQRADRLLSYKRVELIGVNYQLAKIEEASQGETFSLKTQVGLEDQVVADVFNRVVSQDSDFNYISNTPGNDNTLQNNETLSQSTLLEGDSLKTSGDEFYVIEVETPSPDLEEIIYQPHDITDVPSSDEALLIDSEKYLAEEVPSISDSIQPVAVISREQRLKNKEMEAYQQNWIWFERQPENNYTLLHGTFNNSDEMEKSSTLNLLANYEIFPRRLGSDGTSLLVSGSATEKAIQTYKDSSRALKNAQIISIATLRQQL